MDNTTLCSICCRNCGVRRTETLGDVLAFLRQRGRLRREASPSWDFLVQVWNLEHQGIDCSNCEAPTLALVRYAADDDWEEDTRRVCETCSRPIDVERLEVFPETTVCSKCKSRAESGELAGDAGYCPQCGGHLDVAVSRGRSGAYQERCQACGYRSS